MRPGTPGFVGMRLREAREARGISATSLADLIGVSRQAVSQYEAGGVTPHPETMQRIARVLNLPIHFFWKAPLDMPAVQVLYRSNSSSSRAAQVRAERRFSWLLDIVTYLEQFVDLPSVDFPKIGTPSNPYDLSEEDIEAAAAATRLHWALGDGPIQNCVRILEKHGVIISRGDLESDGLDAFSQWVGDRPFVFLGDDKQAAARSRLDSCHELGHLILHRRVDIELFHAPADRKLMEDQAFKFAGAFLMPRKSFGAQVRKPTLDTFVLLKSRWLVSAGAMIKRCESLGIITPSQASNLWITLSKRGWRKSEPLDDQLPPEEPKAVRLAMELVVSEGVQSLEQVLEALPYSQRDIEELCGLKPGYLSNDEPGIVMLTDRSGAQGHRSTRHAPLAKIVGFPTGRRNR